MFEPNLRNRYDPNRIPRVSNCRPIRKFEPKHIPNFNKYDLPTEVTYARPSNVVDNRIRPLDVPIERCSTIILKQRLTMLK